MNKNDSYDAIVIGSGLGGLTAANLLAQVNNKRVLVLEKHFVIGGQTHEFKRKDYSWNVGLHYVGEVEKGTLSRMLFDYISGNNLKWEKYPQKYNKYIYPDGNFEITATEIKYKNQLIMKFPEEKKAIIKYFKDIKKVTKWNQRKIISQALPNYISFILKIINNITSKLAFYTVEEYMDKNFKNDKLKSILESQWYTYLLPPNESSFIMHSIIAMHYLQGASFPDGGAGNIAKTIRPIIEKEGGKLLVNREVTEIIIKNKKAVGVKVKYNKGKNFIDEEYFAPVIISNAGSIITFKHLVPEKIKLPLRKPMENFLKGYSTLTLYLGLKDNPERLGFKGQNLFLFNDYDHNKTFNEAYKILEDKPNHSVLTFASNKVNGEKKYTAQILYYLDYDYFNKWKKQGWLKRDNDYYELKQKISNLLIDYVDNKINGFKNIIDYKELSSPLTMEFFTNREYGVYNGIPAVPNRYKQKWLKLKTPIKNLYLTGSDITVLGIVGAMIGGLTTAAYLNGIFGFIKIISKVIKNNKQNKLLKEACC